MSTGKIWRRYSMRKHSSNPEPLSVYNSPHKDRRDKKQREARARKIRREERRG